MEVDMRLKIMFLALFFVSLMLFSTPALDALFFEEIKAVSSEVNKEYTIVIDPGHGGFDGGAISKDGTKEKDLNLSIALKLKDVAEEYPVKVIMTRTEDCSLDSGEVNGGNKKSEDLNRRKEMIDESKADLTISIHMNSYPEDASVYGAQVFYPNEEQKRTEGNMGEQSSKSYAQNIQKSLEFNIPDGRERQAMTKNDILLFKNPNSPIILVECGFLSNIDECKRLKSLEYQELLATAIWEGINTSFSLEKEQKIQIIQSANKNGKNSIDK